MFPATELNLQEAGGPERQCDHLPVREQGDVRFYEIFAETLQEPFLGAVWWAGYKGFILPPFSRAPATPLESSEGEGVGYHKGHWNPGGQA